MGLFDSSSSSKTTCPPITSGPQYGADNIVGSLNFHKLTIILCGAFTVITFLCCGILILLHATHFSNPGQQARIIRIIALAPIFALVSFLAGSIPSAAIYLQPWADLYEAVALTSYFLLIVTYAVPDPQSRDDFFQRLPQPNSGEGSLRWYHSTWFFVFQYIPVSFIVAIATDITQAVGIYCINGRGIHFAHIWLAVIRTISVILAFLRLVQFYRRLRPALKPYSVVPKLVAIKGIVFLSTLQSIIFTILSSTGVTTPTSKLSYNDINFGIPSILTCGEMVIFSLVNLYAYSFRPYTLPPSSRHVESQPFNANNNSKGSYQGGPLGIAALLSALNPTETAQGLILAVRYLLPPSQSDRYSSLPLRYSRSASPNPASYVPHERREDPSGVERAHIPYGVEYGRVERYPPLHK